eukprot:IDg144t1
MASKPGKKEIVLLLMKQKADVIRDVDGRVGAVTRNNVPHIVLACPFGERCKVGGEVVTEKGTGYTNPYKHLKSCVSGGDEKHLLELYNVALAAKRRSGLTNTRFDLPSVTPPTQREKDLYAYLKIIIMRCLPVNNVWDPEFRDFSKCHSHFGVHFFKEILFKLTELVEQEIARDMQGTKGAIVHDGWTKNSMHYFGVFASFIRKVKVVKHGVQHDVEEHVTPLLSISPLAKYNADDSRADDEATEFDADTHVKHLEEVFGYFNQEVHDWAVCSIADNCAMNKRMARQIR